MLVRGPAVMGRAEATAFGVLMATIMGGTVFMLLAATPFVFNEDIAWSICLTVGSIFALLGVIERPSWGRVIASWRADPGGQPRPGHHRMGLCGRRRADRRLVRARARRAGEPSVVPSRCWAPGWSPWWSGAPSTTPSSASSSACPTIDQVWTHVNAYRRKFLAANHNAEEGTIFIPSNAPGLPPARRHPVHLGLPVHHPARGAGHRPCPGCSSTGGTGRPACPSSMPLLFLLSCWGLVTAFRPRPIGKVALTRILLLAAGAAGAALLLWGYIAPRYLADFVPFLVLASAVAMVDIWRRLDGRSRSSPDRGARGHRRGRPVHHRRQHRHRHHAQRGVEHHPGPPLRRRPRRPSATHRPSVEPRCARGSALPPWGPADQLYVVGDCDGLYISNGENYSTVPERAVHHETTWMTVERGPRLPAHLPDHRHRCLRTR